MKVLKFALAGTAVLLTVFVLSWIPVKSTSVIIKRFPPDPVATHNMLVIGEKTVYLSHLPMFQEKGAPVMPHRYQAILEVEFQHQGSSPQDDYFKDRQNHQSTKVYTINPKPFVLPALVSLGVQGKFKGNIFRGHLEKDGASILTNIDVNVKRVVYFQKFDPVAKRPTRLEYLLFGKVGELFLAHLIIAPPDFDQVISVTLTGHAFSDEELAKGVKMVFRGTKNAPSSRLKEKEQAEGEINPGNNSTAQKIKINVNREIYFEEGELRTPPNFETTAEEKKMGLL